jgi:hypothetical protein
MKKFALLAAAVLLAVGTTAGSASAVAKQEIAMTFSNISFGSASEACPGGLITFHIASPEGAQLGTGSSCIQSFKGCDPFAVGCHQTVIAIFTFNLAGGPVVVLAKLHEVVLDDDPFTVAQRGHGTVLSGDGQLKGEGTISFGPGGIVSTLVYVLRLGTEGD